MQQYRNNVQDQFGNVIPSVTVTVNDLPGGGLAAIFSDDGVTPKSNPFTNDSDSEFNFYAANGRYDIELTGPLTESIPDIILFDEDGLFTPIQIRTDIVTATPPTTEAVTGVYEIVDNDATDLLASWGFTASNDLLSLNLMEAGLTGLQATQAGGGVVNTFLADPDGPAVMYYDGVIRFDTDNVGRVQVYSDGSTDTEPRLLAFVHADGTERGVFGYSASDILSIINGIHGGNVRISGEDVGGISRFMFEGDPDGITLITGETDVHIDVNRNEAAIRAIANAGVDLYFNNVKTTGIQSAGIFNIFGDLNSDTDARELNFRHADGTLRARVGHFVGQDFQFNNYIHGAVTQLGGQDTGGVDRVMVQCDPDGVTEIRAVTDAHLAVNFGNEIGVEAVANGKVGLRWNNLEYFRTQDRTIADQTSGAEVQDGNGVWQDVGFNVLGQVLTDANYTLDRTECGYDIYKQASGAVTYTIPAAAATAQTDIPFGAVYEITNEDTEALTIDGTETGITLRWCPTGGTGDRTLAQWGIARLKKRNDGLWFITGVGLT